MISRGDCLDNFQRFLDDFLVSGSNFQHFSIIEEISEEVSYALTDKLLLTSSLVIGQRFLDEGEESGEAGLRTEQHVHDWEVALVERLEDFWQELLDCSMDFSREFSEVIRLCQDEEACEREISKQLVIVGLASKYERLETSDDLRFHVRDQRGIANVHAKELQESFKE